MAVKFFSVDGYLDGSKQIVIEAIHDNIICTSCLMRSQVSAVTFHFWKELSDGTQIQLGKSETLSDTSSQEFLTKALPVQNGQKIVIQAIGTGGILAHLTLSFVGIGDVTGLDSAQLSYLLAQTTFSTDIGCGGCVSGGKILDVTDYLAGGSYSLTCKVDPAVTYTAGEPLKLYYWTVTPHCPPWTSSEVIWLADFADPLVGGSYVFSTLPTPFEGFMLQIENSTTTIIDTLCSTWDNTTRTLTGVGFS